MTNCKPPVKRRNTLLTANNKTKTIFDSADYFMNKESQRKNSVKSELQQVDASAEDYDRNNDEMWLMIKRKNITDYY